MGCVSSQPAFSAVALHKPTLMARPSVSHGLGAGTALYYRYTVGTPAGDCSAAPHQEGHDLSIFSTNLDGVTLVTPWKCGYRSGCHSEQDDTHPSTHSCIPQTFVKYPCCAQWWRNGHGLCHLVAWTHVLDLICLVFIYQCDPVWKSSPLTRSFLICKMKMIICHDSTISHRRHLR